MCLRKSYPFPRKVIIRIVYKNIKKKKINWAMFPEPREAAFSQASSLLLLVDCSMTGFPLSWALLARLRSDPGSNNWNKKCLSSPYWSSSITYPSLRFKTCCQKILIKKKMEIVNQDLDGSLSFSLSTEIPIYMERDLSMNRFRLSSIRIDMSLSLWGTTPIFICFGHVRFRSEEEGLDLSILCREGCDLC